MSAYEPLSFRVLTTLSAQRVVEMNGTANTVALCTSSSLFPVGITLDTVRDTSGAISVAVAGIAKLYFNDTVTSGGLVGVDDNGMGVPFTAATVTAAYVGVLIGPAVAATGTIADVLVRPGQASSG